MQVEVKSQIVESAKSSLNVVHAKMNYEELYQDLKSYLGRYVDTDETEISFLVLYATGTHFFDQYQTFPILHLTGDYATGKNRRLQLLELICNNPIVLTNPSLSSLFRVIDESKGTIMIDEADTLLQSSHMENILLSGYKKGGQVSRSVRDARYEREFRPMVFEVYCPKVLVTREGVHSDPLNSRSITIITFPKSKDSIVPDIFPETAMTEGTELKNKIEAMLSSNETLASNDVELNLTARDAEIFDCIKDVAGLYGRDATRDLRRFIDQVYIPETRYKTMLSFHEDLIRVLQVCWESEDRAHLTLIKQKLEDLSIDHKGTSIKRIAHVIRSLKFELDRDSRGHYVIPNSALLNIWCERYIINKQTPLTFQNVEDVANEAKSANERLNRRYLGEQFGTLLKRMRLRE